MILADNKETLGDYIGDWNEFSGGARYLRDTSGFYTDSYCSETMRGGVVRLRTARFTMYIPCTYHSDWDGASLYYRDAERVPRNATESDHETAAHEAARMAYQWAESEAEIAREDHAKYLASEDIERARAEIHNTNKQALALLAEIKGNQYTDNVCAALRHRLQEFITDRKRQFKVIEERTENFWSAVPY